MLRLLLLAVSGFIVIAIVVFGVAAALMLTGRPEICDNAPHRLGRTLDPPPTFSLAQELGSRWEAFAAQAASAPTVFQATESELTARARVYAEQNDIPVEDLFVYYCNDGKGQLAGRVDVAGVGTNFVATGTLLLGDEYPVVEVESVDVGNMPSSVSDAVLDLLLDEDDRTLELDENLLDFKISDGLALITGGP